MKSIIKYVLWFLGLGITFFLFNIVSTLLPNETIKKQLYNNIEFYKAFGDYDRPIANEKPQTFDYFTDAWIMNIAANVNEEKNIYSALSCTLHDRFDLCENSRWVYLQQSTSSEDYPKHYSPYARYWFGASFLYRFFFLVGDYATLRFFLYLISSILLFTFLIRQYKLSHWAIAISFLLGLILVNLMFMQYLIQFSSVLIISLSIAIVIQSYSQKTEKDVGILFLLSGALTAYLDLLTAPVLSLGFPLLVWLQLHLSQNPKQIKQAWRNILLFSVLWAVGYLGLFIFKWLLVTIFTDIDIIENVKNQIILRTGIEYDNDRWLVLSKNINAINLFFLSISLTMTIIYSIIRPSLIRAKHVLLYLSVGLIPLAWILVVNEHSNYHYWYTYRILAISIISIFLAILSFRRNLTKVKK